MEADCSGEPIFLDEGVPVGFPCLNDRDIAFNTHNTAVEKLQKVSERTSEFIRRYFPLTTIDEWNDWKWQRAKSIVTSDQLSKFLDLQDSEKLAIKKSIKGLPLRITPYYLSLLVGEDNCIKKTMIPSLNEFHIHKGEKTDPLNENSDTVVPGIVHRYPDRVLFTVTNFCFSFCRYCTRSHSVGKKLKKQMSPTWELALDYIKSNSEIRDVLISGGDPLVLEDEAIEFLLKRLREIPHVEIIRIGTKAPVVMPQRITANLVNMLNKYHPLMMSIHFTHPRELTDECRVACNRIADAGIPMGSQTVLLKGVNDDLLTIRSLMHELLKVRVRPYYLYQCDPIPGSKHFRTSVQKGIEIMDGLKGHTSGYAIPNYVIDAPGGGGKISILPEYVISLNDEEVVLRNYMNNIYHYPNN
jgi:lysine 2,3-aminomutase